MSKIRIMKVTIRHPDGTTTIFKPEQLIIEKRELEEYRRKQKKEPDSKVWIMYQETIINT